MLFQEQIKMVKQAAPELAATTNEQRNAALAAVRTALQQHQEEIFEANRQDMEQAEADGVSGPVRKRLKFDEGKLPTDPHLMLRLAIETVAHDYDVIVIDSAPNLGIGTISRRPKRS